VRDDLPHERRVVDEVLQPLQVDGRTVADAHQAAPRRRATLQHEAERAHRNASSTKPRRKMLSAAKRGSGSRVASIAVIASATSPGPNIASSRN
jgi:hypothetical protein